MFWTTGGNKNLALTRRRTSMLPAESWLLFVFWFVVTLHYPTSAFDELFSDPQFRQIAGMVPLDEEQRQLQNDPNNNNTTSHPRPPGAESESILADRFGGIPGFYHSVASGDPTDQSVVLWTRYTPIAVEEVVTLEFRMAKVDPNLTLEYHLDPIQNPDLKRGLVTVTAATDFVAKLDVTGLESYTQYVYVFLTNDGSIVSDIGLTKTAPSMSDNVTEMTYATFSCSKFDNGYFHAYDIASTITDLDMWIHVGDYVYEYALWDTYAKDATDRNTTLLPEWEQVTLQDHRNRHLTYLEDEGLLNLRYVATTSMRLEPM
ncbi:hypothetical protein ACA910_002509 [Epithemia clementina (nom. ined.)]